MTTTLDSLSSRHVRVLLDALGEHHRLLEASHEDARREQNNSKRPCYVVDYELLHRYMFEEQRHPERVLELEYLFGMNDVAFILGIGTQVELITDIRRRTNIDITEPQFHESQSIEDYSKRLAAETNAILSSRTTTDAADTQGIKRLISLLRQKNFIPAVSTFELKLDNEVYQRSKDLLNVVRPGQSRNNLADALNVTHTMALRNTDEPYFAFVLTSTQSLLRNFGASSMLDIATAPRYGSLRSEIGNALARSPMDAVYASVARRVYDNPSDTADATNELALRAVELQVELRRAKGYRDFVPDRSDMAWQSLAEKSIVGPGSLEPLKSLSSFVSEPIVAETQRIYDNIQQASANLETQRRQLTETEPARKIFDLVSSLSRAVEAKRAGDKVFENAWHYALTIDEVPEEGYTYFCIRDQGDPRAAGHYVEVEAHSYYIIFRWATDASMERVLSAFGSAFAKHNIDKVLLLVGSHTTGESPEFDALLPVTSAEIRAECDSVSWLRMDAEPFDLYADLVSKPDVDAVVGVIVREPNVAHIVELFSATAARFIFNAWLTPALRDVTRRARLMTEL